ncbi:MAG: hypothetical protein M1832_004084 [Thelocarpon impressellum]|nr:MAG: hypothetical protein M1832_004084 [Thelocarpon impressellum]
MSESSSPPKFLFGRIARPGGFLPLSTDDEVLSTRGHHLPGLLRASSSASIAPPRRPPSLRGLEEGADGGKDGDDEARQTLMTPKMRSMRLIGNSNPRYQWEQYYKTEAELRRYSKPVRRYYERTNSLVEQYIYIDRLLDSSLPHTLIQEYQGGGAVDVPQTIREEPSTPPDERSNGADHSTNAKVKRTPRNIYSVLANEAHEATSLLDAEAQGEDDYGEAADARIVQVAIYVNLAANTLLLAAKIAVIVLTSSLSVLASLVDAVLDFLSTAIVWTTTRLVAERDQYAYPVGRRRLEPIGVLVFSVIMITSFFQVLLECFSRLTSGDHSVVQLTLPAIGIMASTVVIKFACWLWSRLIPNSSVQALAQDAMTDVVFNTFSIIFPLVGYYLRLWPLDAIGGVVLSLYVIANWTRTSSTHIRNLTGAAASADERNILLYLTMRFARAITRIQGLQAYHAGDKLNVEVDIVLDERTPLRDSHDLGESLQYVLESVPFVDRAFVHADYSERNLPTHMTQ